MNTIKTVDYFLEVTARFSHLFFSADGQIAIFEHGHVQEYTNAITRGVGTIVDSAGANAIARVRWAIGRYGTREGVASATYVRANAMCVENG